MLDTQEIIKLIKYGVSDRIKLARKNSERLNMNVTGLKAEDWLDKLENHESAEQEKLRKKLIKSNKSLYSYLLRPTDKVFSAKGGSISYNLQERQLEVLKNYISDVSDGIDLKTFLKKKAVKKYIINPNGFLMVDVDIEGRLSTRIYTENDVIWYDNRGNNINAIIFSPFTSDEEEDEREYYRVIDDKTDSIWVKDGDDVYLQEGTELKNFFDYVPAYILGDIYDPNNEIFLSMIDDVLEDGEERMRDVTVSTVHKLAHGYAKYWQYPEACNTCGGEGKVKTNKIVNSITTVVDTTCPTCSGGGVKNRKDASDLMLIDIPNPGEQTIAPDVGGYINPSIEIWKQYNEEKDRIKYDMFQCLWGSYLSSNGDNDKTATQTFVDEQAINDRLGLVSQTFSKIHEFALNVFGQGLFRTKNYQSGVTYGNRYTIERPDQALEKLVEARDKNLPETLQSHLIDKYYETEYSTNELVYQKKRKLFLVDPFPFMSAKDVKELGVEDKELLSKIYYPQWSNQIDDAKVVLMTIEQLKEDLNTFINSKTIKDETVNVRQDAS